jgi:ssDNA-binding replication factor A large subunit
VGWKVVKNQRIVAEVERNSSVPRNFERETVDSLLHKAIERNQVILLVAELLKQRAWEDNRNYVAAMRDLESIIEEVQESSQLLQEARKKNANH